MAFDSARAPGQGQAGDDGVTVAVDASGEGVEAGQVVLPDGVEPVGQALALALGEHGREFCTAEAVYEGSPDGTSGCGAFWSLTLPAGAGG